MSGMAFGLLNCCFVGDQLLRLLDESIQPVGLMLCLTWSNLRQRVNRA